MESGNPHLNPAEMSNSANQILYNYQHDKSSFEYCAQRSDNRYLFVFEDPKDIHYHAQLQTLEDGITKTNEKIQIVIRHFLQLLNFTESFLNCIPKGTNLSIANFNLDELRDALNRSCSWEIQRGCMKTINKFELHNEEFIDKGCLSIILFNFHLLMKILRNAELELAEAVHQQNMIDD